MNNIASVSTTIGTNPQPVTVAVSTEGLQHGLTAAERRAAGIARRMPTRAIELAIELADEHDLRAVLDVATARSAIDAELRLGATIRQLEVALKQHEATASRARITSTNQVLALIQVLRGILRARPDDDALRVGLASLEGAALSPKRGRKRAKKEVSPSPAK